METVIPFNTTLERPRNTSMPDRVVMNGGIRTKAIQKPCHAPMARPTSSMIRMDSHIFIS